MPIPFICPQCKAAVQIPAAEVPVLLEVVEPDESSAPQLQPLPAMSPAPRGGASDAILQQVLAGFRGNIERRRRPTTWTSSSKPLTT